MRNLVFDSGMIEAAVPGNAWGAVTEESGLPAYPEIPKAFGIRDRAARILMFIKKFVWSLMSFFGFKKLQVVTIAFFFHVFFRNKSKGR